VKKKATDDTITALGKFDLEMWTDGSMDGKMGAGAALIFDSKGKMKHKATAASGYLSSSFTAEVVAVRIGLRMLLDLVSLKLRGKSILIGSDSKSLITALQTGPLCQGDKLLSSIWWMLIQLIEEKGVCKIVFQFVYSHCGVLRNELADTEADTALKSISVAKQRGAEIPLRGVKAMVKLYGRDNWLLSLNPSRHRWQVCGKAFTDLKCSGALSRKEEVTAAQLRTGECMLMGRLRNRIGIGDPKCRWCKEVEETVEHVYSFCRRKCIVALKKELNIDDVQILHSNPKLGLTFCERAISKLT
jgi:ribonuclease HI